MAALLCVTSAPSVGAAVGAGAFCGLVFAARPPDLLLAAGVLSFAALFWARDRAWILALSALAAAAPFLLYNWITFRNFAGGYAVAANRATGGAASFLRNPLLPGIAGLLVSPGKGIL